MTINTQMLRDQLEFVSRFQANSGHGHVFPRPDDVVAKCGGPGLCAECSRDQALIGRMKGQHLMSVDEILSALDAQTAEIAEAKGQIDRWKKVAESAEDRAQAAADEIERLRDALDGAATSLNTIATLAGSKDDYMEDMFQVRGYAHSRARVARAALSGESNGG